MLRMYHGNGGRHHPGLPGQKDFERQAFFDHKENETEGVCPKRKPGFDSEVGRESPYPLEEFAEISLKAMVKISDLLGL